MVEQAHIETNLPLLPITFLHRLEVLNAIQMYVFLARKDGQTRLTAESAGAAQAVFREDLLQRSFIRPVSVQLDELADRFEELALRHTANHGFRTYDVVHVASALLLACDTFWSFDKKARKLAALEGLRIQ
jgi:predicted nucleic acid-binding protein